jgi:hypothetical protein
MQPAVEDGFIDDLKPVHTKSQGRPVTSRDIDAWEKRDYEQVVPWSDEVWIEEVDDEVIYKYIEEEYMTALIERDIFP